jgi:hypothetical protein
MVATVGAVRSTCCQRRDSCGWPLDTRGCRYGRLDLTLEGAYSILDQPSGPMGVPVSFVAPGPGLPNQFDWGRVDYDGEFGGRGTIRWAVCPQKWLEVRGAYFGGFTGESRQTGSFGFTPGPAGLGGIAALNTATLAMEADLYSGELNYWQEACCHGKNRIDVGGGVRYVRFDETASATNWANAIIPGGGAPSIVANADNTFYGLQVGTVWHHDFSPCFEFRLGAKVLVGNVHQENEVVDANVFAGGTHRSTVEQDNVNLGLDVDVGILWRISPRFGVTLGYNFLLLDGLARANNVMDFTKSVSGAVQAQVADDQLINHAFLVGLNVNL